MEETKEFTINGCLSCPVDMDTDTLTHLFIEWVESKGFWFGGGIGPYVEEEDDEQPIC